MSLSSKQKLLELKRRILANKDKNSAILFELQELNKSFNDLKEIISNSNDLTEIKENIEILNRFDQLSSDIQKTNLEISSLAKKEIPTPNVVFKPKFEPVIEPKIEVKQDKVIIDVKSPIEILYKSIERILTEFFVKVQGFMTKISEYISQPDRIIISDTKIDEYYGNRKITHRITNRNNELEIKREA